MATWAEYAKTIRPEEEVITFARTGNLQGLRAVIDGENINLQDSRGHSPLILASYHGYFGLTQFLLEAGADVDLRDNTGNTALMGASFKGYLEIVKLLIEYGADPHLENPQGLSAHGFAKLFGRIEVSDYLKSISRPSKSRSSETHPN